MNDMVEGTHLPRVPVDRIEAMIHRDSLGLLGLDREPRLKSDGLAARPMVRMGC